MRIAATALLCWLLAISAGNHAAAQGTLELWSVGDRDGTRATRIARALRSAAAEGGIELRPVPWTAALARIKADDQAIFAARKGEVALLDLPLADLYRFSALFAIDQVPFIAGRAEDAQLLRQIAEPFLARRLREDGLELLAILPGRREQLIIDGELWRGLSSLAGKEFAGFTAAHRRATELLGGRTSKKRSAALIAWLKTEPDAPPISARGDLLVPSTLQWRLLVRSIKAGGLTAPQAAQMAAAARTFADAEWQGVAAVEQGAQSSTGASNAGSSNPGASNTGRHAPMTPGDIAALLRIGWTMADEWAVATGADGAEIKREFEAHLARR